MHQHWALNCTQGVCNNRASTTDAFAALFGLCFAKRGVTDGARLPDVGAYSSSHGSAGALSSEVLQCSQGSSFAISAAAAQHQEEGLHQLHAPHAVYVGLPQGRHAAHQRCCCIPCVLLYSHITNELLKLQGCQLLLCLGVAAALDF